jgi:hypothetical protein
VATGCHIRQLLNENGVGALNRYLYCIVIIFVLKREQIYVKADTTAKIIAETITSANSAHEIAAGAYC